MGEFAKGQVHGRGILSFPEGHYNVKYDGQFVEGKHSGKGTMEWKDGTTYTGDFAEGQVHGKGILELRDGRTFEGNFVEGKLDGHGRVVKTYPKRHQSGHKRYEGNLSLSCPERHQYHGADGKLEWLKKNLKNISGI